MRHRQRDIRQDSPTHVTNYGCSRGTRRVHDRQKANGIESMHSSDMRTSSSAAARNNRNTRYQFTNSSSINSSRRPGQLREMVVEHAMDLLRERQSEVSIDVNDAIAIAVNPTSVAHRCASKDEVRSLHSMTMGEWIRRALGPGDADSSGACVICTETVKAHDTLKVLPCRNAFQRDCIDKWLSIRPTCPICRRDL